MNVCHSRGGITVWYSTLKLLKSLLWSHHSTGDHVCILFSTNVSKCWLHFTMVIIFPWAWERVRKLGGLMGVTECVLRKAINPGLNPVVPHMRPGSQEWFLSVSEFLSLCILHLTLFSIDHCLIFVMLSHLYTSNGVFLIFCQFDLCILWKSRTLI